MTFCFLLHKICNKRKGIFWRFQITSIIVEPNLTKPDQMSVAFLRCFWREKKIQFEKGKQCLFLERSLQFLKTKYIVSYNMYEKFNHGLLTYSVKMEYGSEINIFALKMMMNIHLEERFGEFIFYYDGVIAYCICSKY